jgi:hypothetical protein
MESQAENGGGVKGSYERFWKIISTVPQGHTQLRIYVDELGECGDGVAKELAEYFQCLTSRATLKYATPINITPF